MATVKGIVIVNRQNAYKYSEIAEMELKARERTSWLIVVKERELDFHSDVTAQFFNMI